MRFALSLAALAFPILTWACTIPPRTLSESNLELVQTTNVITLAKVVGSKSTGPGHFYKFTFETVRALKGTPPRTFELVGYDQSQAKGPGDFSGHNAPEFWAFDSGNTIQPGDCVAHGIFQSGETYLIFLRKASHYRAYENVRSETDLWLRTVQVLIHAENSSAR